MSFAAKILQLRQDRNLTQKELARIVGVHFSHMSRYERGISLPSIDVVRKLAQMFHVSADYLLFDDSQAMVRADITDPELLRQFELLSRMHARERTAVKTILDALILKHRLEGMLGVQQTSLSAEEDDAVRPDPPASWSSTRADAELFQDLEAALGDAKRSGVARRRSTQRVS